MRMGERIYSTKQSKGLQRINPPTGEMISGTGKEYLRAGTHEGANKNEW